MRLRKNKNKLWTILVVLLIIVGIAIGAYFIYQSIKRSDINQSKVINNKNLQSYEYKNNSYPLDKDEYRVMHWNILNYGGKTSKMNSIKVTGISQVILASNADIIGLTEINDKAGLKVDNIIKTMEKMNKNRHYKYIVQSHEDSYVPKFKNSIEQVAIIYNSDRVSLSNFDDGSQNKSFNKDIDLFEPNGTFSSKATKFVRPLFGANFELKKFNKKLVTFFGHLDSPGQKSKSNEKDVDSINFIVNNKTYKIKDGQGNQEISEAFALKYAFKYFKEAAKESSLIFGGDTNIKKDNHSIFDFIHDENPWIQNYYDETIDEKLPFLTSLGSSSGYSNPYDKFMFYEKDLNILDSSENTSKLFKIDIVNGFNNNLFNHEEYLKLWNSNPDYHKKHPAPSDFRMIRQGISDHAPIVINIKNS